MTAIPDRSDALPCPERTPEFYEGLVVKRGLAWVVDALAITLASALVIVLTLGAALFVWPLVALAVGAVYRVSTLARGSATWGMRLMGIELRDHAARRLDGQTAALHVLGYYVSVSFALLPVLASVVAMLATERRQGLTDLILGTAAINRPG